MSLCHSERMPGMAPGMKASGAQAGCMQSMNAGRRGGKRQSCGLLREAQSAPECTGGKRQPCGLLGQRPKETRRCEQIQGPGTVSARNADICEGSETMSTTEREVRMIEQPGRACEATHLGV